MSRRNFIKVAGLAGVGTAGLGLVACSSEETAVAAATAAPVAAATSAPQVEELDIDLAHEEKVNIFLEGIGKDDLFWGNKLDYTMDGDTKVFTINCQQVEWEMAPGKTIQAFT